ncbi:MAG: alpha/beta hydrolase [Lachnospiraceae bacterium]|nr:alpha/beta hydrolase [Lachnospiraceae bacterium]
MESNYVRIKQLDGYQTRLFQYETQKPVLASILILHGMAEHHERYLPFIQQLNQEGFDVYIYNHRGHGTDKKLTELGYFAPKGGSDLVVNDAHTICRYIKDCGRSEKLAVFGHSMGSLILRCLIQQYDAMDCAIVCATTMPSFFRANTGLLITRLACLFRGPKKQSKALDKMMFGSKKFTSLCSRTSCDWLTRNNTIVGKYIYDPYCGFICTTSFYRDLLLLAKRAGNKKNILKTRRNLPVHFLAGDKDPVGGYAKEVLRLHSIFRQLGFSDTGITVYPDARHELLNELNADEIMADAITFFHQKLDTFSAVPADAAAATAEETV